MRMLIRLLSCMRRCVDFSFCAIPTLFLFLPPHYPFSKSFLIPFIRSEHRPPPTLALLQYEIPNARYLILRLASVECVVLERSIFVNFFSHFL